mmetsp:Transcript_28578/g.62160  ORF Transcript_28578/g.62160 Transcript_28578/m.62160 type:complete len:328 (-) Transcript_28578:193-1176(-)|eukprot:CAMPEP_0206590090 /NCGR_PEP_ID=MMETSP0325_2-20121206/39362_1 /ASSEMBLY_ACC=CAM_ASM_000347 /TAXON_ID=2866 /ORGANISM="Crypthecodinium cohnii, Strain Seligo" /LENGTH=327 /DNA_ID=CAMNT_0054098875 /DNA_START=35 /DNA_END=1018 /DNA_ORIENTATION=+
MSTVRLQHAPQDGISRLRFAPIAGNHHLLVSSWDSHIRLYDTYGAGRLIGLKRHNRAILDCCFMQDTSQYLAVGLDARLVTCDFQSQKEFVIGQHDAPIKCVEFHAATNQVFTASWDRTLRGWDLRQPSRAVAHVSLGTKAFCMDTSADKVIVGGADRQLHIYDIRSMHAPLDRRESTLHHQIRAVQVSPCGLRYASSSIEGRVALEYFNKEENDRSKYAFKCHRTKNGDEDVIHAVNALAFHPTRGTFASGGSDSSVCFWDGEAKKRIWKLDPFSTSIASLSFSADGSSLAIGVSYTFDEGEKYPCPSEEVVIQPISDQMVAPKVR